ncbi:hypothetical protein HNY73_009591 [Argiope bruennichi]|uniref:EGF-like domain-containing protein n=1 Tax=Argiope bruennichi TaxID=94029 RepID=A0A8T0FCI6_ARGBR|nr:hypothetical protein HNY73_009591 [Argiope bruennichi]
MTNPKVAGTAEILRASQKDEEYMQYLRNLISDVTQKCLGIPLWIKWKDFSSVFSDALFYSLTTLSVAKNRASHLIHMLISEVEGKPVKHKPAGLQKANHFTNRSKASLGTLSNPKHYKRSSFIEQRRYSKDFAKDEFRRALDLDIDITKARSKGSHQNDRNKHHGQKKITDDRNKHHGQKKITDDWSKHYDQKNITGFFGGPSFMRGDNQTCKECIEEQKEIFRELSEKILKNEERAKSGIMRPAYKCDEWVPKSRTCWLNRNIGDTVTFILSFSSKLKRIPKVIWKQEFHERGKEERKHFVLQREMPTWNIVIGSKGHEMRVSPISEIDVDPNLFSASLADENDEDTASELFYRIRLIPSDLGFVYPGETLVLNMASFIALPLESLHYVWYMEKDSEFDALPSNMKSSPSGSVLTISELRKEQEGIMTCAVYSNLGILVAKKRFLIKELSSNDILMNPTNRSYSFQGKRNSQHSIMKRRKPEDDIEKSLKQLQLENSGLPTTKEGFEVDYNTDREESSFIDDLLESPPTDAHTLSKLFDKESSKSNKKTVKLPPPASAVKMDAIEQERKIRQDSLEFNEAQQQQQVQYQQQVPYYPQQQETQYQQQQEPQYQQQQESQYQQQQSQSQQSQYGQQQQPQYEQQQQPQYEQQQPQPQLQQEQQRQQYEQQLQEYEQKRLQQAQQQQYEQQRLQQEQQQQYEQQRLQQEQQQQYEQQRLQQEQQQRLQQEQQRQYEEQQLQQQQQQRLQQEQQQLQQEQRLQQEQQQKQEQRLKQEQEQQLQQEQKQRLQQEQQQRLLQEQQRLKQEQQRLQKEQQEQKRRLQQEQQRQLQQKLKQGLEKDTSSEQKDLSAIQNLSPSLTKYSMGQIQQPKENEYVKDESFLHRQRHSTELISPTQQMARPFGKENYPSKDFLNRSPSSNFPAERKPMPFNQKEYSSRNMSPSDKQFLDKKTMPFGQKEFSVQNVPSGEDDILSPEIFIENKESRPEDDISKIISRCKNDRECAGNAACIKSQASGFCRCLPNFHGNGISCWEDMVPRKTRTFSAVAVQDRTNTGILNF